MTAADDERARRFDALFRERSPDVIAYCRRRARSSSDAQDAVAEVFLTAWRRLDDVPPGDATRIWLYPSPPSPSRVSSSKARLIVSHPTRSSPFRLPSTVATLSQATGTQPPAQQATDEARCDKVWQQGPVAHSMAGAVPP